MNHSSFIFLKLVLGLRMLVQADLHSVAGDPRFDESLGSVDLCKFRALAFEVYFKDARFCGQVRKKPAQIRNQLRGTQVFGHQTHLEVCGGLGFAHLV